MYFTPDAPSPEVTRQPVRFCHTSWAALRCSVRALSLSCCLVLFLP